MNSKKSLWQELDWATMGIPLGGVLLLVVLFFCFPTASSAFLYTIRTWLGNQFSLYYAMIGVVMLVCSLYVAFSKYGSIILGKTNQPEYSSFQWGMMIFTSTMAADILFYSLCEWALYANEPYLKQLGSLQQWGPTFPLFHWGPIAWSFYILLAVAFGFMLHVRQVKKQKFSEACRPLLGKAVDGWIGKMIDLLAVFALVAGTATTFSLATPLLSAALSQVFGLKNSTGLTIGLLVVIAIIYTSTVVVGVKGVSLLATACSYLFFTLLAYFLLAGGEAVYILETGFSAVGNLVQHFVGLATWLDPLRETSFPQKWTIYYWSYWMVWSVATPFFIGSISKGRSIKNTILGAYAWGLAGTFTSFIILGNYGLAQQLKHGILLSDVLVEPNRYSTMILKIFETLPFSQIGLLLLAITMIAFYATTFDALTLVISAYSYKTLHETHETDYRIRIFWAVVLILFPIALIFSESSMYNLQSVAMIAAFPIGGIILLIVASFFKEVAHYYK